MPTLPTLDFFEGTHSMFFGHVGSKDGQVAHHYDDPQDPVRHPSHISNISHLPPDVWSTNVDPKAW